MTESLRDMEAGRSFLKVWANGTYAEAKKACIAHIKSIAPEDYKGFVEVKVGA